MANDLTINRTPDGNFAAYCNKCGRHVDEVEIQTPVEAKPDRNGFLRGANTGEIIVAIKCHGEEFTVSNWHGEFRPARPRLSDNRGKSRYE